MWPVRLHAQNRTHGIPPCQSCHRPVPHSETGMWSRAGTSDQAPLGYSSIGERWNGGDEAQWRELPAFQLSQRRYPWGIAHTLEIPPVQVGPEVDWQAEATGCNTIWAISWLKTAYGLCQSLRMIFSKNTIKDAARLAMARWYNKVEEAGFHSFNVIAATSYEHYEEILNFYNNHASNAMAESFNAKIKLFRANIRGVADKKFFLFRIAKLYAYPQ